MTCVCHVVDNLKMKNRRFTTPKSPKAIACITVMAIFGSILAIILIVLTVSVSSYPLHASCKIKWDFDVGCSQVRNSLVTQIEKWKDDDNCKDGGEKCLYKLIKQTESEIKATHMTPKKKYIDDLTFSFTIRNQTGCIIEGFSTSETWYAVLDFGTNYCNLHNLITGAELEKLTGYKESTSNSICTQFSSADCDKY